MELVLPTEQYQDSFIAAVREFQAGGDTNERGKRYKQFIIADLEQHFAEFVEKELSHARGENLPEGYVPETTLWLIDNNEFIGRVGIRHTLTEHLLQVGGHIGYDIRPGMRMRGYGSKILGLALPYATKLGIDKVLVTCDTSNIGSRKIIERNGGVLENRISDPAKGIDKLRFWISL
jgi:predicted acetyltransferase